MKKQKQKLSLDTFKIARLTINFSSIMGGSSNCVTNTLSVTESSECPDTINTDTITIVDSRKSTFRCADQVGTNG
jgi:hypothetical protein